MNVSLNKNNDAVSGILKLEIVKADYAEQMDKELRGIRQKANVPGFRRGMVPLGMIKKMYGKQVMLETINKLVSENLFKYIRENDLHVLGEPMPNETEQKPLDFDKSEDFEFCFDLALAPEINIALSKEDKLPFYSVKVDDEMINGQVDALLDTQDFDLAAVESVKDLHHFRISAGEYANPFNKGAVVNKLDFVILAALEVDVHFNCNVVVDSNGMITGAQGGHPDTAAGAKCAIVIAPLLQGRTPAICTDVTTVTTPGESVDVVITDYGIAINPRRQDLIEAMKDVDLPFKTIEELRDIAYSIAGEPQKVQFGDRVVGVIESRDGTIMDVVRQIKPFEFDD